MLPSLTPCLNADRLIFMGLPGLWWEEPNMASIFGCGFMANSQRFDTANRAFLLLILVLRPTGGFAAEPRVLGGYVFYRAAHP
jgi:hypothetical protein